MPGTGKHYSSPERMPLLEPLDAPDSEASTLRDPCVTSAPQPPFNNFVGLVLENKGNVARDHLASERTYLAYVRTSLACASAGVALVQLFTLGSAKAGTPQSGASHLTQFAKPVGATTVLFALVILVFGFVRYFSTQAALVRGQFPVARHSITMIAFVLASLVALVFGLILAATPSG